MLDSGAFSSFSLGKIIHLKNYIEFAKTNEKSIKYVINLDSIDPSNPEAAAAQGRKNFLEMCEAGIESIPVHHAKESMKWLELMVDDCKYIGISGTSIVSTVEVYHYYNMAFNYLSDAQGQMLVNTHLFGDTSPMSLLNYPTRSADSATWMIQGGRAARVNLDGKSIQLRSTKIRDTSYICASDTGPKRQGWEEAIARLGLDPERVMNIKVTPSEMAMIRAYLVLAELLKLQERTKNVTKFKQGSSLLNNKRQLEGGKERVGPVNCFCVLSPSAFYFNFPLVALQKVSNVLVSYHYVADAPAAFWPERLLPFLYDPIGFCESNPKTKRYLDKMRECLLKQPEPVVTAK